MTQGSETRHSVPKYYEMVRATLASLRKRGGVASNQEIEDDIVAGMNLNEEAAAELHGKGPHTKVGYNAYWTRTWLRKIGAIEPATGTRTRRGVWTLTAKGRDVEWAESRAETEVKEALQQYQKEAKQKKPDCCINRKIRYCPDQAGSRLRESPSFPRKRESIASGGRAVLGTRASRPHRQAATAVRQRAGHPLCTVAGLRRRTSGPRLRARGSRSRRVPAAPATPTPGGGLNHA